MSQMGHYRPRQRTLPPAHFRERLDFTVIGPAVNEVVRIAAMCRSVDQPVLTSSAFANVDAVRRRLVSVGRYALRGVSHAQELFALDPTA
jgi:adenylate cyclase